MTYVHDSDKSEGLTAACCVNEGEKSIISDGKEYDSSAEDSSTIDLLNGECGLCTSGSVGATGGSHGEAIVDIKNTSSEVVYPD